MVFGYKIRLFGRRLSAEELELCRTGTSERKFLNTTLYGTENGYLVVRKSHYRRTETPDNSEGWNRPRVGNYEDRVVTLIYTPQGLLRQEQTIEMLPHIGFVEAKKPVVYRKAGGILGRTSKAVGNTIIAGQ